MNGKSLDVKVIKVEKPPNHHLKVVDVTHLHLQEPEALPEVLEEEEEEAEELEDLPHVEGIWMMVAIPCILT
ncbi:RNA-binding motif protein, X chromosome [Sciurus carolinensis]|uniref:RNA-binding motif protein, X chromosome n=1 Tax=Sciurus carolinensis TaxID=30640 RepID=A0AA41SXP1_SCICA|nr:RNA-binding motif protein, X chromosome [Sciurus carolinensis]